MSLYHNTTDAIYDDEMIQVNVPDALQEEEPSQEHKYEVSDTNYAPKEYDYIPSDVITGSKCKYNCAPSPDHVELPAVVPGSAATSSEPPGLMPAPATIYDVYYPPPASSPDAGADREALAGQSQPPAQPPLPQVQDSYMQVAAPAQVDPSPQSDPDIAAVLPEKQPQMPAPGQFYESGSENVDSNDELPIQAENQPPAPPEPSSPLPAPEVLPEPNTADTIGPVEAYEVDSTQQAPEPQPGLSQSPAPGVGSIGIVPQAEEPSSSARSTSLLQPNSSSEKSSATSTSVGILHVTVAPQEASSPSLKPKVTNSAAPKKVETTKSRADAVPASTLAIAGPTETPTETLGLGTGIPSAAIILPILGGLMALAIAIYIFRHWRARRRAPKQGTRPESQSPSGHNERKLSDKSQFVVDDGSSSIYDDDGIPPLANRRSNLWGGAGHRASKAPMAQNRKRTTFMEYNSYRASKLIGLDWVLPFYRGDQNIENAPGNRTSSRMA
jgi:hypothetical protein